MQAQTNKTTDKKPFKTFEYYRNGTIHGTIKAKSIKEAEKMLFAQYGRNFEVHPA
jgi:hypothetical protein